MPNFELREKNSYGSVGIVERSDDLNKLLKTLKQRLYEINIDNPLTMSDKERNWEAYAVVFDNENNLNVLYGDRPRMNNPIVFVKDKNDEYQQSSFDSTKGQVRIYLGDIEKKPWFAKNLRKQKEIDDIEDSDLRDKSIYYFAIV